MKKLSSKLFVAFATVVSLMLTSCLKEALDGAFGPSGTNDYWNKIETDGPIEAKYLKYGSHDVAYHKESANGDLKAYKVFYPKDMPEGDGMYPTIIVNNGTGASVSTCPRWFEHMASWGFIVVGNDDPSTWDGHAAEQSLCWLLKQNEDKGSIFYGHVDTSRIGVIGHSQGGVAVFSTLTRTSHQAMYKTGVALSPTGEVLADSLHWHYDASAVSVPMMLISGTGYADQEIIIPIEALDSIYRHLTASPFRLMARHRDVDHGQTLVIADGYVTAWMMWQLNGDTDAAKAFTAPAPEIAGNSHYQDVKTSQMEQL